MPGYTWQRPVSIGALAVGAMASSASTGYGDASDTLHAAAHGQSVKWKGGKGPAFRDFVTGLKPDLVRACNDADKTNNKNVRFNVEEILAIARTKVAPTSAANIFFDQIEEVMVYDSAAIDQGYMPSPLLSRATLAVMCNFAPGREPGDLEDVYNTCMKAAVPTLDCFAKLETFHPQVDQGSIVQTVAREVMTALHTTRLGMSRQGTLSDMHGYPATAQAAPPAAAASSSTTSASGAAAGATAASIAGAGTAGTGGGAPQPPAAPASIYQAVKYQQNGMVYPNAHSSTALPLVTPQKVTSTNHISYNRSKVMAAKLIAILCAVFEKVDPGHEMDVVRTWKQGSNEALEEYISRVTVAYGFVKCIRFNEAAAVAGMVQGLLDDTLRDRLLHDITDEAKSHHLHTFDKARQHIGTIRSVHEQIRANIYAVDLLRQEGASSMAEASSYLSGTPYGTGGGGMSSVGGPARSAYTGLGRSQHEPAESGASSQSMSKEAYLQKEVNKLRKSLAKSKALTEVLSGQGSRVMAAEVAAPALPARVAAEPYVSYSDMQAMMYQAMAAQGAPARGGYAPRGGYSQGRGSYGQSRGSGRPEYTRPCPHCNWSEGHSPDRCWVINPHLAPSTWKPPQGLTQQQYKAHLEACRRLLPTQPRAAQAPAAPLLAAAHYAGQWAPHLLEAPPARQPLPAPTYQQGNIHLVTWDEAGSCEDPHQEWQVSAMQTRHQSGRGRGSVTGEQQQPLGADGISGEERIRNMPASFVAPDQGLIQPGGLVRAGGGARFELPGPTSKLQQSACSRSVPVQFTVNAELSPALWAQVASSASSGNMVSSPGDAPVDGVYQANMVGMDFYQMRWKDGTAPNRRAMMDYTRATLDKFVQPEEGRGVEMFTGDNKYYQPDNVHLDSGAELNLTFTSEVDKHHLPWQRYAPGQGPTVRSAGGDALQVVGCTGEIPMILNRGQPTEICIPVVFQVIQGSPFSFSYLVSKDFMRKTGGVTDYNLNAYHYRVGYNEQRTEGRIGTISLHTESATSDPYYHASVHACTVEPTQQAPAVAQQGGGVESSCTSEAHPFQHQRQDVPSSSDREGTGPNKAKGGFLESCGQFAMGLFTVYLTVMFWFYYHQEMTTICGYIMQPSSLGLLSVIICCMKLTSGRGYVGGYVQGFEEVAAIWGELVHLPFMCVFLLVTCVAPWWEPEKIWLRITNPLTLHQQCYKRHARRSSVSQQERRHEVQCSFSRKAQQLPPYREKSGWKQAGVATVLLLIITVLAGCTTSNAMQHLYSCSPGAGDPISLHPSVHQSEWRVEQQMQQTHLGSGHLVQQLARLDVNCFRCCSGQLQWAT